MMYENLAKQGSKFTYLPAFCFRGTAFSGSPHIIPLQQTAWDNVFLEKASYTNT
jgi:hypothetical protein